MTTFKTFILPLAACASFNVLNDVAMACPENNPDCAVPEEVACNSESGIGCVVPEELACTHGDPDCAVPDELACVMNVDCKVRVPREAALACTCTGDNCKVAPMPKTLLAYSEGVDCVACVAGVDCVAIAILPPPEIA